MPGLWPPPAVAPMGTRGDVSTARSWLRLVLAVHAVGDVGENARSSRPGPGCSAPSGDGTSGEARRATLPEQAIGLRQEPGEVEPGRASGAGGVEVGAAPVSLLVREPGIGVTGMAAGAMVLVVGQEPGQIAQPCAGPRGSLAPAVAG